MRKVVKRKLSVKKTLKIIVPLIIILIIGLNFNNILYFTQSKITGYPVDTIRLFHSDNIYNVVKNMKYSDTLNNIIKTRYYDKKYLDNYLNIKYHSDTNFIENVSKLLTLGYTYEDINNIYDNLNHDSISTLLDAKYYKDISNILGLKYFHEENFKRYLLYEKDIPYEDRITYVNIGLDKPYYTDVTNVSDYESITVLVNKYNALPNSYVPSDLENISNKYNKGYNGLMRHEARIHFEEMCANALKDGITIYSGSAYRSYNYQLNLYNRYVNRDGLKLAETYTARAGYSEHQTGLATDIMNAKLEYIGASDKEYEWLLKNSYKYGFILRYPNDKEEVTGYMAEEWHFRYLGKDIATYLYENNLTYDEYVARK